VSGSEWSASIASITAPIHTATVADAILDRLLSRSHRLNLKGKSMRPNKVDTPRTERSEPAPPQVDDAA
jgi:DNA replication protein DnaC